MSAPVKYMEPLGTYIPRYIIATDDPETWPRPEDFRGRPWQTPNQTRDDCFDAGRKILMPYVAHVRKLAMDEDGRRKLAGWPRCPRCRGHHGQVGNIEDLCEKCEAIEATARYDAAKMAKNL